MIRIDFWKQFGWAGRWTWERGGGGKQRDLTWSRGQGRLLQGRDGETDTWRRGRIYPGGEMVLAEELSSRQKEECAQWPQNGNDIIFWRDWGRFLRAAVWWVGVVWGEGRSKAKRAGLRGHGGPPEGMDFSPSSRKARKCFREQLLQHTHFVGEQTEFQSHQVMCSRHSSWDLSCFLSTQGSPWSRSIVLIHLRKLGVGFEITKNIGKIVVLPLSVVRMWEVFCISEPRLVHL